MDVAGGIEPGSPWENPFVESFGSRVRDEMRRFLQAWAYSRWLRLE